MSPELQTMLTRASEAMLTCGRSFLGAHAALEALRHGLHAADCQARHAAEAAETAAERAARASLPADVSPAQMVRLRDLLAQQHLDGILTQERGMLLLREWFNPDLTAKQIGEQFCALPGPRAKYSPGTLYRWVGLLGLPKNRRDLPGMSTTAAAARHATIAARQAPEALPAEAADASGTAGTDPHLAWLQQRLGRAPDAPQTAGELAEFRMGLAAGNGARFLATTLGWPVHVAGSLAHIIRTEGTAA